MCNFPLGQINVFRDSVLAVKREGDNAEIN